MATHIPHIPVLHNPRGRLALAVIAICLILGCGACGVDWTYTSAPAPAANQTKGTAEPGGTSGITTSRPHPTDQPFPSISTAGLGDDQLALLQVLQQAYADQPAPTTFSQGVDEPWCADFVSWAYNQIGLPFNNPNSGGWRIPGVYTLQDYFQSNGIFHTSSSFVPQLGDVVIYDDSPIWGAHTNIVLALSDGQLTTIGGNQPDAVATDGSSTSVLSWAITISTYDITDPDLGIQGYGRQIQ